MYLDDVGLNVNEPGSLEVVADENIFRRLHSLRDSHPELNFFLGGWHTNKVMCIALIKIFSNYGIFKLAELLGV